MMRCTVTTGLDRLGIFGAFLPCYALEGIQVGGGVIGLLNTYLLFCGAAFFLCVFMAGLCLFVRIFSLRRSGRRMPQTLVWI